MAKTVDSSRRLQQLIEERQRYEGWAAALETRRAGTPPQVFARIESDYREHIARIKEELGARAGEVRERITALVERLASLEKEESTHRDAKMEAELRTAVGEYSPERGMTLAAEADKELSALAAQRHAVDKDLGYLREILAQSSGEAISSPAAPRPPASTSQVAAGASPAAPVSAATSSPSRNPAAQTPERHRSESKAAVRGSSTAPAQQHDDTQSASQALAQNKTLKCAECRTFNYPTEWYCENCGAELAAL